jgi:transcriptional regulator with XRE-family HTH domain
VLRAASTTAAPSRAKSRAAAAPMPRLAPVMNTTLPVSRPMGVISVLLVMPVVSGRSRAGYRHKRYQDRHPRSGQTGGMDKQELGAFLRSRRERLRPEDVGLPSGARRRTPGLRREEVAVLAHISTEYYVRLEQGRAPRPSGEVLAGIAGALRLTGAESDHLHVLAGTAPSRTGVHRRDVRPSILALLERLPQTAAFVTSAAFEVLAWNDLAAALMEDFAELAPEDRNLARRAFLRAPRAQAPLYGVSGAAEFRQHVVMKLRITLARYPADPAVTTLVDDLRDGSPEFRRLWERHDVQAAPMLTKTFRHPVIGEITVDCDSLTLTDRDQNLVLYTAPAGSRAAEALALLNVLGAESVRASRPV